MEGQFIIEFTATCILDQYAEIEPGDVGNFAGLLESALSVLLLEIFPKQVNIVRILVDYEDGSLCD